MNEVKEYFLKRPLDVMTAGFLLLLSLPAFLLIMPLVWWETRASVFSSQEMTGRKGKAFNLLRFRTLQPGVDKIWKGEEVKEDDPGTTRVGRFLINARLVGLPVLWNVLRGDMSFVGPRPERPDQVAYLSRRLPRYNLRHMVRPGLVSLATVYGDEDIPASHRLKYDLFYLEKMGLMWDTRLLVSSTWRGLRGQLGLDEEEEEEEAT